MKKLGFRMISLILVIAMVFGGLAFYTANWLLKGESWASFKSNGNVYKNGKLIKGAVTDRNGTVLAEISNGRVSYAEDRLTRLSTVHAVGDRDGNIAYGALKLFVPDIIGYSPVTGTYSFDGNGGAAALSIDAELNRAAYEALDGRKGCVAVSDMDTGEIICMVSSASFDPEGDGAVEESSGAYLNRFLSAAYTPGSVFKLVTLAAALENIDGIESRSFHCDGTCAVGGGNLTCTSVHGDMKIEDALAKSCNCVFGQLAMELGADKINEYAEKFGLTERFGIDGAVTAAGRFDKAENDLDLAWSGVGQYNDTVNPAAMMRLVSAIANGGYAREMTLLKGAKTAGSRIMSQKTADKLAEMMDYCVQLTYGAENFPGLVLRAKSGTAEVGSDTEPHAWFVGFTENDGMRLAFTVVVENGGWGSSAAGSVANRVLQAALNARQNAKR